MQDPPKSEKCIKIRQTYWNAPNCKEIQQIYQIGKYDSEQAKMLHHVTKMWEMYQNMLNVMNYAICTITINNVPHRANYLNLIHAELSKI